MIESIRIAVDVKQRRPCCVILQANFGCERAMRLVGELFDSNKWVLAPNENVRVVTGTLEQIKDFATQCNGDK